jgi:hypothetical protein
MTFGQTPPVEPMMDAEEALLAIINVNFPASTTIAAGTVLGPVTATPGTYKAYASGNSDGSQIPAGILRRSVVTDASGNITNFNQWSAPELIAPMYTKGTFLVSELTGLDANAVTVLGGHYIGSAGATRLFQF